MLRRIKTLSEVEDSFCFPLTVQQASPLPISVHTSGRFPRRRSVSTAGALWQRELGHALSTDTPHSTRSLQGFRGTA